MWIPVGSPKRMVRVNPLGLSRSSVVNPHGGGLGTPRLLASAGYGNKTLSNRDHTPCPIPRPFQETGKYNGPDPLRLPLGMARVRIGWVDNDRAGSHNRTRWESSFWGWLGSLHPCLETAALSHEFCWESSLRIVRNSWGSFYTCYLFRLLKTFFSLLHL